MISIIYIVAALFFGMGVCAFIAPHWVIETVGGFIVDAKGRNEVRAVYGGFGVVVAGMLAAAPHVPMYGPGFVMAIAIALYGMVAGRIVSAILDRAFAPVMVLIMVVEIVGATALVFAVRNLG